MLGRARPKQAVTSRQMKGVDHPAIAATPRFLGGVPLPKALHEDTIVALRMNGRPLSKAHGAPARLVMPTSGSAR